VYSWTIRPWIEILIHGEQMKITPRLLRLILNLYGPYLGAGVHITHISNDWRELRVSMKLHWYKRNVARLFLKRYIQTTGTSFAIRASRYLDKASLLGAFVAASTD
jgi:hypothetical protein